MAEAFCKTRGARLPNEAEYEFLATGFGRYEKYPWGTEAPRCGDAVFGRAFARTTPRSVLADVGCAPAKGTAAVGTARRDRLVVPGRGTIVDLLGNVSEWVSDDYGDDRSPCWAPPILLDPRCTTPAAGRDWTARGAYYAEELSLVEAKPRYRAPAWETGRPRSNGVRCVRSVDDAPPP